jgi:hypothetical protein
VPLCSVDGVTHSVEIKIGKTTPLDERVFNRALTQPFLLEAGSGGDERKPFFGEADYFISGQ